VLDPVHNTVYSATPSQLLDKAPAELKSVLQSVDVEQEVDKLIAASDITVLGTEQVAGIDAYKLDVKPKPDAAEQLGIPQMFQMQAGIIIKDLHANLWVDKDRWIPLKVMVEHPNMGQFTATTSKLELNKPVDPSKFTLQVPAGAKTVDLDALSDKMASNAKSTTLAQARTQATADGWKLLEPAYLPGNATLIEVVTASAPMNGSNATGFVLNYSSPTTNFSIIEGKSKYEQGLGDGFSGVNKPDALKDVQVRGVTGKAFSPDGSNWTALFWQEKDNGIWVAIHGKLSLDEATKLAESLK
jgi:hypothetical protein